VTGVRLDRVFIFGEQLSFLVPHDWVESDEASNSYLYHAPSADSGWLRASLISIRRGCSRDELRSLLNERAKAEAGELSEVGSNIVVAWEKDAEESGDPITHFWWAVGHYHGPKLSHEALFSYTVPRERRADSETRETVSLLAELVADATFAAPKIA
jgi:hypothetical protein